MKAPRRRRQPGHLAALLAITLATGMAGCGLKGDLYLEEEDAGESTPPAAATGDGSDAAVEQPAEPVISDAAMATGPSSPTIEPVTESELKEPGAETEHDAGDTTAPTAAPNAVPEETETKTGSTVSAPAESTSDPVAPAQ